MGLIPVCRYIHRLDPVFIRRLKFLIQFNLPGASEREQLWQRLIPEKVPREDGLDFAALAQRYELSGGQISKVRRPLVLVLCAVRCSCARCDMCCALWLASTAP